MALLGCIGLGACRDGASTPEQTAASEQPASVPAAVDTQSVAAETAAATQGIELDTASIDNCITFKWRVRDTADDRLQVDIDMKALTSTTGDCGCKSALLEFTAVADIDGPGDRRRLERAGGTFDSRKPSAVLELGERREYGEPQNIIVIIGCATAL
jgi:hypothetical protein